MGIQANPYPLRIDKTVMAKAKAVAAQNGRSLNKEIEFVLRGYIADYESRHGEIKLPEEES